MKSSQDDEIYLSSKNKRLGLLLWFHLSHVFNQNIRLNNQHLKQWNLSTAQFDMLVQIGVHERLTQKELGEKLLVTKGNITQLLSKMEKLGWIERERQWKTKYLSLTEKGKELYNEVVPKQEQFQASQFCNLDREEQLQLLELLKKATKKDEKEEEA